jgi:hypothetical protein
MSFLGHPSGRSERPTRVGPPGGFDPPKLLPYGNHEGGESLGFSEQAPKRIELGQKAHTKE